MRSKSIDQPVNTAVNSQRMKFEALARELEADQDEARWDERLAKVAKHKPTPETEQPE